MHNVVQDVNVRAGVNECVIEVMGVYVYVCYSFIIIIYLRSFSYYLM